MAFGIDDALMTAAAGISLTDTVVKTVQSYRQRGGDPDLERLIEEVRITALERIDDADNALATLERTLRQKDVDLSKPMGDVISATPWWRPFEQYRLRRINRSFNMLSDATCNAVDDITALLRCRDQTGDMGIAVVESAAAKEELRQSLLDVDSFEVAIKILRDELLRHKTLLMQQ